MVSHRDFSYSVVYYPIREIHLSVLNVLNHEKGAPYGTPQFFYTYH